MVQINQNYVQSEIDLWNNKLKAEFTNALEKFCERNFPPGTPREVIDVLELRGLPAVIVKSYPFAFSLGMKPATPYLYVSAQCLNSCEEVAFAESNEACDLATALEYLRVLLATLINEVDFNSAVTKR